MDYKKIMETIVGLFLFVCKCFLIGVLDETGKNTCTKDSG